MTRPAPSLDRPRPRRRLLQALLLLAPALPACAARVAADEGLALEVHDGDSFVFRAADGSRRRVRLSGVDAPEREQPFADRSRRHLRELLAGARVRIEPVKRDAYDRVVARVVAIRGDAPGEDVALAQLRAGLAWHFTRYRADQSAADFDAYAQAQARARTERTGLWRDAAPEPPWAFRQRMRRPESDRRAGSPAPPAPRSPAG